MRRKLFRKRLFRKLVSGCPYKDIIRTTYEFGSRNKARTLRSRVAAGCWRNGRGVPRARDPKHPAKHRSVIAYGAWSSLAHAFTMTIQSVEAWAHGMHRKDSPQDIVIFAVIGVALLVLYRQDKQHQPARLSVSRTLPSPKRTRSATDYWIRALTRFAPSSSKPQRVMRLTERHLKSNKENIR